MATTDPFLRRTFTGSSGGKLHYRLLNPKTPAAKGPRPLLLFLHGAGQRGRDNKAQLNIGREFLLRIGRQYGCVIVAPQCPPDIRWTDLDWSKVNHVMPKWPSLPLRLTIELLGTLQKKLNVDPDRIYVMGLSMGSYGTWDLLSRWPEMFAAAVPVCGGGDPRMVAPNKARKHRGFAHVPVWAFHGDIDTGVPVENTRVMIAAMRKAGGKPRYTEYRKLGHNVWDPAMAEKRLPPWIFKQRRTL